VARRLERAFDRCAKHLGHALGSGARALTDAAGAAAAARHGASTLPSSEGASPYLVAAAALAVAPAVGEAMVGPVIGAALGLVRDVGLVLVAAGAVRAVVVAEGERDEAWTPVFRAAMRRAHGEGRCGALVVEVSDAASRWADAPAGARVDAAWLGARALPSHVIDALVERAPEELAVRLGSRAIAVVPFAASVRTAVATSRALRDALALVRLVEDEARDQMRHRPAVVVAFDAWRSSHPARVSGVLRGRRDRDERVSVSPRSALDERSAGGV
jgi:hypothetical protein